MLVNQMGPTIEAVSGGQGNQCARQSGTESRHAIGPHFSPEQVERGLRCLKKTCGETDAYNRIGQECN